MFAIAGILAMEPGHPCSRRAWRRTDPSGKKEIMDLIASWHAERGMTTVLVTHDMDDVVHYADEVVVMEKGTVVFHDSIHLLFSNEEQIEKWHLDVPVARQFQKNLENQQGLN